MFFCRDQYRRAAHDFGQAVIGRSDIADEFDSYFNPSGAAGELIEQIARLYQFSDILGCRNELHRFGSNSKKYLKAKLAKIAVFLMISKFDYQMLKKTPIKIIKKISNFDKNEFISGVIRLFLKIIFGEIK